MKTDITSQTTGEHLVTTRQLAKLLQIHEETVRRWVREKRLTGLKIGRSWRVPSSELHRISQEGGI